MSTIIHKLRSRDWARLHEIHKTPFLHGNCYAFALALHEGLGWPMVGLILKKRDIEVVEHAGVRSPDGRIFDIRGFVSEEEFVELYTSPPYDIQEVTVEDLNVTAHISEYSIRRARGVAEILWPELPWKKTYVSEVLTFANELEALCRKHNKWIRSPEPAPPPQLQEGDGSEGGYTLRPTIDGFGYTINCRIGK